MVWPTSDISGEAAVDGMARIGKYDVVFLEKRDKVPA
jgi:hypothetical protein